jgi:tetratricopeptide (TPR) repeat protein
LAKYQLKDFRGALADYNQALKLQPHFADALYNRGAANYNLKDRAAACSDWDAAQKLGNAEAGKMKAQYCRKL